MNDSTRHYECGRHTYQRVVSVTASRVSRIAVPIALLGAIVGFVTINRADEPTLSTTPVASDLLVGEQYAAPAEVQQVFMDHCATCHGVTGQGDGPASYLLFPKPRDFTTGLYRFKSTFNEAAPSKADVERTIRNGIPRTAMPAFDGVLGDEQITSLIDYVLSLNGKEWPEAAPKAVKIPPQPDFTADLVSQGRQVFETMGCPACHGTTGRGDGPSAEGLVDSLGYPLPPADFTNGVFKAGRTSEDLYRTILVGVPGTPMPSFEAAMNAGIKVEGVDASTDMVWAIVAYLESLIAPHEHEGTASGATLTATPVAAAALSTMTGDPFDGGWNRVPATAVSLQPLWQRRHAARSMDVRVVRSDDRIAFCLEWVDATVNGSEMLDTATDAAGIMFSLTPAVPMLTMGQTEGDQQTLVNIWHWKASRQIDADTARRQDIALGASGEPADYFPFKSGDPVAGPLTEHDPTYIAAWGAGNPQSAPALFGRSTLCMTAAGFGTLTIAPPPEQNVDGVGRWREGVWRTVFVRDLPAHHEGDVDFTATWRIPLAFAAWDGAALDRNGTKLISGWHWLDLSE